MRVHPYNRVGRMVFRTPIWLYRLGLRGLLGDRFLLLRHKGRRSGRLYNTVIEVIKYDPTRHTYYVLSGFGRRADWFRNIQKTPEVTITVGRRRMPAHARVLPPEEGARILEDFIRRHPLEVKVMIRVLGYPPIQTEKDLRQFVEMYPVVEFQVTDDRR